MSFLREAFAPSSALGGGGGSSIGLAVTVGDGALNSSGKMAFPVSVSLADSDENDIPALSQAVVLLQVADDDSGAYLEAGEAEMSDSVGSSSRISASVFYLILNTTSNSYEGELRVDSEFALSGVGPAALSSSIVQLAASGSDVIRLTNPNIVLRTSALPAVTTASSGVAGITALDAQSPSEGMLGVTNTGGTPIYWQYLRGEWFRFDPSSPLLYDSSDSTQYDPGATGAVPDGTEVEEFTSSASPVSAVSAGRYTFDAQAGPGNFTREGIRGVSSSTVPLSRQVALVVRQVQFDPDSWPLTSASFRHEFQIVIGAGDPADPDRKQYALPVFSNWSTGTNPQDNYIEPTSTAGTGSRTTVDSTVAHDIEIYIDPATDACDIYFDREASATFSGTAADATVASSNAFLVMLNRPTGSSLALNFSLDKVTYAAELT